MKINSQTPLKIYVNNNGFSSIANAVNSLFEDLSILFVKPILCDDIDNSDIVIDFKKFDHIEEFEYSISDKKIYIYGNDDLGVVFGIYAFLENELNVPPFYKIEGLKLYKHESLVLENKVVNDYPQSRFRGWFINDEDLLTGFKSKGKRNISYEYYNEVIDPSMMDMLAETILRYRFNLVIPSTLVDLANPFEEELVNVCSRRGLYISQHHIEPLGVSKFGFNAFCEKYYLDPTYSFITNRETFEKCWEFYAKKWNKYPRVIFQLGLRGGTDVPVWATDKNVGKSSKDRGALISSAIDRQYEIIKKNYKHDIYTTSTLWMEGADLLASGDLKLPNNTITILSDIGMSQLFGDDFFKIKRDPNRKYGTYYHAGYWHTGPHLCEGVIPEKMKYCYELMREFHNDYYSILNVANVKEHTFTIFVNRELTWNSEVSLDQIYTKYAHLYCENNVMFVDSIKTYFASLGDVGEEQYKRFCNKYNFSYHNYKNLSFPVVSMNDGMFRSILYCFYPDQREAIKTPMLYKVCIDGLLGMKKANEMFTNISFNIPESYRIGFNQHWVYQTAFWCHIFMAGKCIYEASELFKEEKFKYARELYNKAIEELDSIFKDREKYYMGEYKNWFNDDRKIGINFIKEFLELDYSRNIELYKDKNKSW